MKFTPIVLALLCAASTHASNRDIYPDPGLAPTELAAGLRIAAESHKRVIVDFGGNWCGDCKVLDLYFQEAVNAQLIAANFVLVHVNIGQRDQNLDLAARYHIPLEKGVPALAVLSERGELLYSQKTGEFESMRRMSSSAVTEFLSRWKPI